MCGMEEAEYDEVVKVTIGPDKMEAISALDESCFSGAVK